jgi:hypothetical protein
MSSSKGEFSFNCGLAALFAEKLSFSVVPETPHRGFAAATELHFRPLAFPPLRV